MIDRPELDPINIIREEINKTVDKLYATQVDLYRAREKLKKIETYCKDATLFSLWKSDIKKIIKG
jgi:hypothetical protein